MNYRINYSARAYNHGYAVIILFLLMIFSESQAQGWFRDISYLGYTRPPIVIETSDGGFLVAGKIGSFLNSYPKLAKFDASGNQLWTKDYPWWSFNIFLEDILIQETTDSGVVFTGAQKVIKINSVGDSLWTRHIPAYPQQIIQINDGGYVVAANDTQAPGGVILVKLNSNGDYMWSKETVGDADYIFRAHCITEAHDGGYVIGGDRIGRTDGETYGALVIKTDAAGDTLWTKRMAGNPNNRINSVATTRSGGIICAGVLASTNSDDYLVIVSDDSCNFIFGVLNQSCWTRFGYFFDETVDGGIVVVGNVGHTIKKFSETGQSVWNGDFNIFGKFISATRDKGYILTGTENFRLFLGETLYLMRIDSNGTAPVNTSVPSLYPSDEIIVSFTNFGETIRVKIQPPASGNVVVELLSTEGRHISTIKNEFMHPGKHTVYFPLDYPPGMYFLRVSSGMNHSVVKLVKY